MHGFPAVFHAYLFGANRYFAHPKDGSGLLDGCHHVRCISIILFWFKYMARKPDNKTNKVPIPNNESVVSSGIQGLDLVMHGGYSRGRVTLIRGASGSGKTLFSLMFAGQGGVGKQATVFASFDEPVEYLQQYLSAWGNKNKVKFIDFTPDPEVTRSGDAQVDLGGILVRLELALKSSNAKLLILDAFDVLFSAFQNEARIRWQLNNIFNWCRRQGVTLLATAGVDGGYEASTDILDYASDCSILLTQRVDDGLMTRRLRVLKLRGRGHGTNEYPFLIDRRGISVLPVTATTMSSKLYRKRLGTGNKELDQMLGGKGMWQGSTVMISGQSGPGKSILSASMAAHACSLKNKVLYISFEEAPAVFMRDVRSAGVNLNIYVDSGLCKLIGRRPVELGMEEQVILLLRNVQEFRPDLCVIDPISSLMDLANHREFKNAVLRLCHALKEVGITTVFTELLPDDAGSVSHLNISSIVDTWIKLNREENKKTMHRYIRVHKSRGSATSANVNEFFVTSNGIEIEIGVKRESP